MGNPSPHVPAGTSHSMLAYLTGELTFGSSVPLMGRGDLGRVGVLQCK